MQLFANNADSSLNGAIAPNTTVLALKAGDGAKFPSPTNGDFFLVTLFQRLGTSELNHEIVKCTSRAGDNLTVVRAQEGTVAKAFNSGDLVELRVTAGTLGSKADADSLSTKLDKAGGSLTGALNFSATVDVASAATTDIGAVNSNFVQVTGTAAITRLGVAAAGVSRTVIFAGALTLTHNAASLKLPGSANIGTAAGDVADFVSLGSGNWRCTGYMRASGQAVSVSPLPNTITKTVANPGTSSFTAFAGNHYLIWSAITATLPASPVVGDTIYFTSYIAGWTIARNGNVISGIAEDLVVDIGGPGKAMKTFGLRFIDAGATVGWAII